MKSMVNAYYYCSQLCIYITFVQDMVESIRLHQFSCQHKSSIMLTLFLIGFKHKNILIKPKYY